MIHNLSLNGSLITNYLAEIRDVEIQKDAMRFRLNLERMAELMGYEISKTLPHHQKEVRTPLGISNDFVLSEQPVLVTILRAGLAMHNGLLRVFDRADNGYVSAYRKHTTPEDFDIHVEYLASPSLHDRICILSDPMLATGNSMLAVLDALKEIGEPKKIIVIVAIATPLALEKLQKAFPSDTEFWVGAIDETLTAESYIVPGLGDAGDLAFGVKL